MAIKPHLPVCQLCRCQLPPTKWSLPTTKSSDPILVTVLRVGFPVESIGPPQVDLPAIVRCHWLGKANASRHTGTFPFNIQPHVRCRNYSLMVRTRCPSNGKHVLPVFRETGWHRFCLALICCKSCWQALLKIAADFTHIYSSWTMSWLSERMARLDWGQIHPLVDGQCLGYRKGWQGWIGGRYIRWLIDNGQWLCERYCSDSVPLFCLMLPGQPP